MLRRRRLTSGLLVSVGGLLAACSEPPPPRLPPLVVQHSVLDVVRAFDEGAVRVVAQEPLYPVAVHQQAALLNEAGLVESDADRLVIRAHAESAFEIETPVLERGATLLARSFLYTSLFKEPERADPAPVTFRVLVDGTEQRAWSSDYIVTSRQADPHIHPYDQLLRTEVIPLDDWAGRSVTLRFETTRFGAPGPRNGIEAPEVLWWTLDVRQPVPVARQLSSPDAPNLLVLCVDTLAAGRTSLHGHDRDTTPNLAALAARGTVFDAAGSASSWTLPSTASLLTGLPPNTHGILGDGRDFLVDGLVTWPEVLRAEGLEGAAFVANPLVLEANNFHQGFGTWSHAVGPDGHQPDADELNGSLLEWVDGQPENGRWFAYVHYMDPHAPYEAPGAARERYTGDYVEMRSFDGYLPGALQREEIPPFAPDEQEHVKNLYDGEVAWFDEQLGALLAALDERGELERTVILLTADHGEELFEYGRLGHGLDLVEETVHVPLVVAGPGIPAGERVPTPVSTAAVYNTVIELAGATVRGEATPGLFPITDLRRRGGTVFALVRTQLFGPQRTLASGRDADGRKVIVWIDAEGRVVERRWADLRGPDGRERVVEADALTPDELRAYEALTGSVLEWFEESARARLPEERPEVDNTDGLRNVGYIGDDEDR